MTIKEPALKGDLQQKQVNLNFSADLIRTIAIFLVILVHASSFPYPLKEITALEAFNWYTEDVYSAIANMGVPLFVMLSGVLLLDPIKADEPMKVFFNKRLAKIGLPWIFWTITYFAWNYYVNGIALSQENILSGLFNGSNYHLWFLYLIFGLYLATPILRILVKNLDHQRFKYLIIIWIIGSFSVPFVHSFIGIGYNPLLFVFTDWVGYYLLGVYLLKSKISKRLSYAGLIGGLVGASVGDVLVPTIAGVNTLGFFHEYLVFTTIAASASLFLILISIPKNRFNKDTIGNRCLHWVGQNTLPIYLIHIMILETVKSANRVFQLNSEMLIPIIQVPLLTVITLGLSIAIVYPLKKIPYMGKIIG